MLRPEKANTEGSHGSGCALAVAHGFLRRPRKVEPLQSDRVVCPRFTLGPGTPDMEPRRRANIRRGHGVGWADADVSRDRNMGEGRVLKA